MSDPLIAALAAAIGEDWAPVSDAARTVTRTPATVWTWVRRDLIRYRRIDHRVYVHIPDVRRVASERPTREPRTRRVVLNPDGQPE
jgi:hypothetical protein